MNILKKYNNFINESVDSDRELKSLIDVPTEVFETAKRIANDIFDRVRKPEFEYVQNKLILKFVVTEADFRYIDEDEHLTLDDGVKKKRMYDVSLEYIDRISETFEVKYRVKFEMIEDTDDDDFDNDDDDDDVIVDDEYEKPAPEDLEYFDEDEADKNIKKGKIKIEDFKHFDIDDDE